MSAPIFSEGWRYEGFLDPTAGSGAGEASAEGVAFVGAVDATARIGSKMLKDFEGNLCLLRRLGKGGQLGGGAGGCVEDFEQLALEG